ncbi:hypothetical protein OPW41_06010 [Vibrio europaeus]|uniref:Uncharacterized protein n=1 Tax=Vibrio europaeus TaxID=300876 RepID=A0A178J864_9VIBR|nr:DUF6653 family protein [Vibrio europaeus]MDC5705423.1 hypothetical protein [Vibrio europaeus]MDC5710702.1 hypothetical protein [Vibrio europaeus]MDC5715792.1 hypothetical protein [Vibrio europaeus]MDC5719953.1 hypothetical protein [Vibrio europaeus]MDC5724160.1 hypothetical protein [Vibrio europaeus]
MDILKFAEKAMSMDDDTWAKHSSPWSVYSRFSILPLLTSALASREWLGWYALIPTFLVLSWIWLNPRVFPAPTSTNNWASMGTFGERIYLNRNKEDLIPKHHLTMCKILMLLQLLGLPVWLYGIYTLQIESMLFGTLWLMATKAWFVDRMVWIYQDVKNLDPTYQSWLQIPTNKNQY